MAVLPMVFIVLAIIFQGMLRDGVTTWMPSYINDTYKLGSSIAILTGVVLPIFSIITFRLAGWLYKKIPNPLMCAAMIFGLGTVSALALYLLSGSNPIFSVLFSAMLTGSMHGVNIILICMIPPYFSKYGNVSTVSGVLNSCTYIGSAISTYGIALLSEKMGWSFTLLVWLAIAAAGTLVCLVCVRPWKKKMG
jgi:OPA family glycerol-3-phosphate transporter-like MFS transporter